MKNVYLFIFLVCICFSPECVAQSEASTSEIQALIQSYKNDSRGPYHRIKWFCDDGTEREPKDPCPDKIGGIQHASFKESALKLRKSNHLFFSEILASNDYSSFLDVSRNYDRIKQYQLNKYLASIDDGWVLQKAQFYRGALQSEDEESWGKAFFEKLLRNDDVLIQNYYLIRQALRDIPHNGDDNVAQLMRSQSKTISDDVPSFMDLRIKIHGQPEKSDINLVENYVLRKANKLSAKQKQQIQELIETMTMFYKPIDFKDLKKEVGKISQDNGIVKAFKIFFENYNERILSENLVSEISNLLHTIRLDITSIKSSRERLIILDISNQLENTLIVEIQNWNTDTLVEHIEKINTLACASMGTGLIEEWEYNAIESDLNAFLDATELSISQLNDLLRISRSIVEWNTSMVKANYQEVVDKYSKFESIAYGFIDDRIRSSVTLSLGDAVSKLGVFIAKVSNINNNVMSLARQSSIRGLNPGYALGELVVIDGNPDAVEVHTNKIYIFERPPADLKPVAGIMTVSEGNLVSHVQLLARNLGIPNAALSNDNLKALLKYNGQEVFYAVSNKGNVILKSKKDMTKEEEALFTKKERSQNSIVVPVDQLKLNVNKVVNMRNVDAGDSGKLCGPKAANLGELKKLFPNQVVEGLIIPFGIFRNHMDQSMPNENQSYWDYLNTTFANAKKMSSEGISEQEIEVFQLKALNKLHKAILEIPLDSKFISDLNDSFQKTFKSPIGNVPVFLRSDTNMEDLKEFTGAGLNLTLFNIKEQNKIIEGIKRVWASAYTERSFKWRQKYLLNPENVFPSILIIPSVDVDYSGVMITKGINSGNDNDLTVAFSRGAGGAVDGQSAETRLVTKDSDVLLAPARQSDYIRLPSIGGTQAYYTSFNTPILKKENIKDIRVLAKTIRATMAEHSENKNQAYDVEFGFKDDKLWLFQIRPFVENKQAKSSEYLESISPKMNANVNVKLSENLNEIINSDGSGN